MQFYLTLYEPGWVPMATFLPSATEQFDDLKSEMIMTLELQRGEGCDVDGVPGDGRAARPCGARCGGSFSRRRRGNRQPPSSVGHLKTLRTCTNTGAHSTTWFQDTLGLAYRNRVPRHNLMLNQAHADLRRRVGGPIAELYTRVRSEWRRHVAVRPWDEHRVENRPHLDARKLDDALTALARGDELDAEDAINNLCGPLRSAFADFLTTNPDTNDLEVGLWRRPELLVAAEYWTSDRQVPLIQALAKTASPRFGVAFSTLSSFFEGTAKIGRGDDGKPITDKLARVPEAQRERFFRCLLMHPSYEMRRYAANNVTIDSYWQVLTTPDVPCATILTLLEQIVGSNLYTTSQRKVFFDVTYKRLLSVTAKSDVLYTRGIVRILSKLNFFLEDDYFSKLMGLLDYLVAKERHFGVEDSTLGRLHQSLVRGKTTHRTTEKRAPRFSRHSVGNSKKARTRWARVAALRQSPHRQDRDRDRSPYQHARPLYRGCPHPLGQLGSVAYGRAPAKSFSNHGGQDRFAQQPAHPAGGVPGLSCRVGPERGRNAPAQTRGAS